MFEDMSRKEGIRYSIETLDEMEKAYSRFIHSSLNQNTSNAWVAFVLSTGVGSAVLSSAPWIPSPVNPTGEYVYLHSIYVDPLFRRRGIGLKLVRRAIAFCREKGVAQIQLHTSDQARPLYEKLGFKPTRGMKLTFAELEAPNE
jgi:GNAT superfamily N-acetyltransferase